MPRVVITSRRVGCLRGSIASRIVDGRAQSHFGVMVSCCRPLRGDDRLTGVERTFDEALFCMSSTVELNLVVGIDGLKPLRTTATVEVESVSHLGSVTVVRVSVACLLSCTVDVDIGYVKGVVLR